MNDQQPEKKLIENDDVEAHRVGNNLNDDTDRAGLLEDDVEGHRIRSERAAMVDGADDDDVEGHRIAQVQPPRDADNSGNQF